MKTILTIFLVVINLFLFAQTDEFYRSVDWKFYPEQVVQLTDSTYSVEAMPFDYNDPGAANRIIGNYVLDFIGHRYEVIDSTATTITIYDVHKTGQAPQSSQIARCYRSVGNQEAEFIGSVDYSPLDESARWKLNGADNELLWRRMSDLPYLPIRAVTTTSHYTGFPNHTDTQISFDDASYTFTVTATNDTIWINGAPYNINTILKQLTVSQEALTGLYWFWFTAPLGVVTLNCANAPPGFDKCLIATVYWNTTTNKGILSDERHWMGRDKWMHEYLHETIGARYAGGLTGTFGNTTFSFTAGEFYDEDMEHEIPITTDCKVLYHNGNADWAWVAGSTTLYKVVNPGVDNTLQYNNVNTLTSVTNNRYANYWIFATGDELHPIHSVIGTAQYTTLALARAAAVPSLGNLASAETKLIYKVTYQNNGGTPAYQEAIDYRTASSLPNNAIATDHGTLTGLADLDHPAAAIINTSAGTITATTVQTAIDYLDTKDISSIEVTGTDTKTITLTRNSGGTLTATFPHASGTISGLMTSSDFTKLSGLSNYTLPTASTTVLGGIKPDGITITVNGATGVASAVGGSVTPTVTKVGTPANDQIGVWTGDGTIEGESKLTYDGFGELFINSGTGSNTTIRMKDGDNANNSARWTFDGTNLDQYLTLGGVTYRAQRRNASGWFDNHVTESSAPDNVLYYNTSDGKITYGTKPTSGSSMVWPGAGLVVANGGKTSWGTSIPFPGGTTTFLRSDGTFAAPPSGFGDPMTTRGDIIYRNSSNATARLGLGTNGQVLQSNGSDLVWGAAPSGTSQWTTDTYGITYGSNIGVGTASVNNIRAAITSNVSGNPASRIYNSNSGGHGLWVYGGSSASEYSLLAQNYTGTANLFNVRGNGDVYMPTLSTDATQADMLYIDVNGKISRGTKPSGTGGGDVYKSGTPVNGQIATWSNSNTIYGSTLLTSTGFGLDITSAAGSDPQIRFFDGDALSGHISQYYTTNALIFRYYNGSNYFYPIELRSTGIRTPAIALQNTGNYEDVNGSIRYNGVDILGKVSGAWVSLTTGTGGDNWGTQVVQRDNTLAGNGTLASPLRVDTTRIATLYDLTQLPSGHNPVTLNTSATAGGLGLSNQDITFRAATNAQTGYATASHISAIEANTAKITNQTHSGDASGSTTLTINDNKVLERHLKAVNSPLDEQVLTYEITTGDFEWQTPSSGSTNYWQAGTGYIAPATITDEVRIGSVSDAGDYKLQVSGDSYFSGKLSLGADWGEKLNVQGRSRLNDGFYTTNGDGVISVISSSQSPEAVPLKIKSFSSNSVPLAGGYTAISFESPISQDATSESGKITNSFTDLTSGSRKSKFVWKLMNSSLFDAMTLDYTGALSVNSTMTATNFILSDRRLKENIKPIHFNNLDKINWVQFNMKADSTKQQRYGVVAQDLEKVLPQFVNTANDSIKTKSVNYVDLLIYKVAQMDSIINALENRIKILENEK